MRRLARFTATLSLAAGLGAAAGLAQADGLAQDGATPADKAALPPVATSVVTVTAAAPSAAARAEILGMSTAGLSRAPATGYSYVIYFPAGTATLTPPARDALAAIAGEVTGLELSRVTVTNDEGLDGRTEIVRDALIEMGVPARWIGIAEPAPAPVGPVSMAPLRI